MERAQGSPVTVPVEPHPHPARLKQVRDVNPLPQRRPKIDECSAHESRTAAFAVVGSSIRAQQCDCYVGAVQEVRARSGKLALIGLGARGDC